MVASFFLCWCHFNSAAKVHFFFNMQEKMSKNVKFLFLHNKKKTMELFRKMMIVQPIMVCMMQEYDFTHTDSCVSSADMAALPSEQTLQNILGFARCCQTIDVSGMKMRLFLN